ncbi:carbonic anhydrase family protein [Sporosarcina sp. Marseille-Q4063]|uniref:carbonic anhydrase n=1 Tax=Sporosarcina sp. Marseille-Q4063 TaxID=2810514 RepID=UPI001BAE98BB|nr:carbonic anhydrase family protein [Sporosarcina sp. Marseille-Q4063]QUW20973.1 carbonic anhydrase family protein [Sporosarcina sp. Marseille-Q4063]
MKKYIVYPFLVVSLSLLLGACSEETQAETATPEKEVTDTKEIEETEVNITHTPQWSYEEEIGPEHWGELNPSYSACMNGNEQSPINIESSQVKTSEKLENVEIQYEPTDFSITNTGLTIQANPAIPSNSIVVEGKEYILAQFHFHTPSEHQFNSQHLDMELHLVHQDTNGELAVLGLMIQEGKENETLASIWGVLPKSETEEDIAIKEPVDLEALLPSNQTSFHYNGSLTTPPCAEKVKWTVFEEPIEMSKEQIQAYQQIFPDNQRPVQPINEREIFGVN